MQKQFKYKKESEVIISELMKPSHSNFSGKIHGGYILEKMDGVAFACASKHSGHYCVTASVNTVNFIRPIEVGELVSMKATINHVGRSSMVVVAKDDLGNNVPVPGLILENENDVRRFIRSIERKKEQLHRKEKFGKNFVFKNHKDIISGKHNIRIEL